MHIVCISNSKLLQNNKYIIHIKLLEYLITNKYIGNFMFHVLKLYILFVLRICRVRFILII